MKDKLAIIVPYRDREQQLKRFLSHMKDYIKDIDYEIFIIEQADDKPFNRGKLLNAGYKYALDKGCDYFVFHDVDMLPEDVDGSLMPILTRVAYKLAKKLLVRCMKFGSHSWGVQAVCYVVCRPCR